MKTTPLHHCEGDFKCSVLLLEAGANPFLKNFSDLNFFEFAKNLEDKDLYLWLAQKDWKDFEIS